MLAILLLSATPTRAEEADAWEWGSLPIQAYDVLLLRPLGLASLIAGAGFFALGAPVAAAFGDLDAVRGLYVEDPFEFTFRRPLGDLEG